MLVTNTNSQKAPWGQNKASSEPDCQFAASVPEEQGDRDPWTSPLHPLATTAIFTLALRLVKT